MNNSTKLRFLAVMAMAGIADNSIFRNEPDLQTRKIEQIKQDAKTRLLKQGCKEFIFDDIVIYAINQKNACRKYDNYLKAKRTLLE
jgi:hypothetical protein